MPVSMDIQLAEAMLQGATSISDIADLLGEKIDTIRDALRNPVAVAWISSQVAAQIQNRLGLVDAAVAREAAAGSIPAAKLLYERYGKFQQVHRSEVLIHRGLDYSKLSDTDLDEVLKERLRAHQGGEDRVPRDAGREGAPDSQGAITLVPTVSEAGTVYGVPEPHSEDGGAGREQGGEEPDGGTP